MAEWQLACILNIWMKGDHLVALPLLRNNLKDTPKTPCPFGTVTWTPRRVA